MHIGGKNRVFGEKTVLLAVSNWVPRRKGSFFARCESLKDRIDSFLGRVSSDAHGFSFLSH
jgi:hypothetical protein